MSTRAQTLILIIFVFLSLTLTRINIPSFKIGEPEAKTAGNLVAAVGSPNLTYEKMPMIDREVSVSRGPSRNWDVLDPKVSAEAVLIQSLDDHFPFLNYNTYVSWPIASLTKLITALVVFEDIGINKKIPISAENVVTEGEAGGLKSGEVYTARDLLKMMLVTSSNDAAAAFETYLGKDELVRLLNKKAQALGMTQTILHDGSGLSDLNQSSASDLLRLARYILENNPEILSWTRLTTFWAQPINDPRAQNLLNIDPLTERTDFLGGKTGTSPAARENLLAVFSHNDYRIAVILLGSVNRYALVDYLLDWMDKAYKFY